MTGIDTNVLVRFAMQDDPEQSALADGFFAELSAQRQGYVSLVVLVETAWVLRRSYRASRAQVVAVLQGLLEAEEIVVEQPDIVRRALLRCAAGGDFADAVVAECGLAAGCERTVTFDRGAGEMAGMALLLRHS